MAKQKVRERQKVSKVRVTRLSVPKARRDSKRRGNGKGKGEGKGCAFTGLLKRNAAGMTVFTGTCYECGVIGHTGKFCPQRDPSTGRNGTCALCGLWGHEAKV